MVCATNIPSYPRLSLANVVQGWDPNPRTHTRPDLKPGAFDQLSHPCVNETRLADPLQSISSLVERPAAIDVENVARDGAVGQEKVDAGRNVFSCT